MKISCKLRIKRPRGLIIRFGWFCKSFQLKINVKCKLIWGLFQRARFLVKLVYKVATSLLSLLGSSMYICFRYTVLFFILRDCI